MGWNIKVGVAKSFKSDFNDLTRERQKAVRESMSDFMRNPKIRALDYEQVQGTDWLWSIRSNLGDRAFLKPYKKEGVYLFLTVGDHDNARERAKRKQIEVNPYTGAVQIFEVPEQIQYMGYDPEAIEKAKRRAAAKRLFEGISQEDLLHIGVPKDLLGYVLDMVKDEFSDAAEMLPQDTYEYLTLLVEGETLEDVLEFVKENSTDAKGDIAKSLDSPASKETIFVVENQDELSEALTQSWEDWMIFLHPAQRRIAEADFKGSAKVIGAAGTGKTVIAMHRAKHLASLCGPDDRVLFTTFTINLTADISRNLKRICTPEEYLKIDVINLDEWVAGYLMDHGLSTAVLYNDPLDNMWNEAAKDSPLGFNIMVYKNEWETVVMPQRIVSYEMYAKANRTMTGLKLDAVQRKQMWAVFDRFISLMKASNVCDNEYGKLLCEEYIRKNYGNTPLYRHIIIDEAQDFGGGAYRLLRAMAGKEHRNDLYITGDPRQCIYGHNVVLSQCGINVALNSEMLKINYRTTEEIKDSASSVLADIAFTDMDKGQLRADLSASLTHGPAPVQRCFAGYDEEVEFIVAEIQKLMAAGTDLCDICVATRPRDDVARYMASFKKAGLKVCRIEAENSITDRNTLRCSTMHRIKGLEFKYVFICSLNDGILPPSSYKHYYPKYLDDITLRNMITKDRSLLYVAMTRARQGVYLTSCGIPSDMLPKQPDTAAL